MKEILFISGNMNKVREVSDMLGKRGIKVRNKSLEVDEIQDKDTEKVAARKAEDLFRVLREPVLVEDTGLYLTAMNGYPGSLIKSFIESIDISGMMDFLDGKDRKATAVTVFAYCDSQGKARTFKGEKSGRITEEIKVTNDFDWDCMFIPEGHEETYAGMSAEVKNSISHRSIALKKFAEWFSSK